jgi:hypothetical protein
MSTVLRHLLYGVTALIALCFAPPSTARADHDRDRDGYWDWHEQAGRSTYYYGPRYRYYEPRYRYYGYPRVERYYGTPGYRSYRQYRGGGSVHVGPVHVWW